MQQALLDPYNSAEGNPLGLLAPAHSGTSVDSVINHSARLTAQEHLAIYQRSYIARLRSCMVQQFSALEYALGSDLFQAFADDYLTAFPSTHYNLSELGRLFPAYLQANRPDALSAQKEDWIEFVIELATFEYAISELFDRQADEDYRVADMQDADDQIGLVPTCALFKLQFPSNTFYTRFKKGESPDPPFMAASYCVVVRHQYRLAVYDVQPDHYAFLGLLAQGLTVSAAKTTFIQHNNADSEGFARMWPVWKQNWIASNLLQVTS